MSSAAEAETGGVYGNAQEAIVCQISLRALGHPQEATPLKTDNSTSNSFVHANIKQRRSKMWDMRWNWLRDKTAHDQLRIYSGTKDKIFKPITLQNIILRRTILRCAPNMF
jgi:hypothetical protein